MSLVETASTDTTLHGHKALSPQVEAFEAAIRSFRPTAKDIHTRIGSAIRRRRRAVEITLFELAKACGVSFQQVQKYETGACAISHPEPNSSIRLTDRASSSPLTPSHCR